MGWYTLIQIILQFVTHLFLPGYLLYDLWKQPGVSRFKWLVKGIHHSSYVFYIFLAGRWDIPGYYLRYMWVVLLILAALISYRQVRALTFYADERRTEWEIAGRYAFTFLLFLLFISASLRGYFPRTIQCTSDFHYGTAGIMLPRAVTFKFSTSITRFLPRDSLWILWRSTLQA